ncbi:MAG: 50S ribosomal protein L21 [Bacteroidetes bacterium]|nr:50S ribosomal protein L21 [Bacteroidota bacterium]
MYAIVEIAGQQFKVSKDQEIYVHRLEGETGSAVNFDNVLLLDQDGKVTVGAPTINGVMIKAKIVEHLKGDKVLVFHKKRRKGYQKQTGHRQFLSKVWIEDILTGEAKTAKPETTKKARIKKETTDEVEVPKKSRASRTETENPAVTEFQNIEVKTDENPDLTAENKVE